MEKTRLREARENEVNGKSGGRMLAIANGEPFAKTIARMVMRGTTSRTIRLDRGHITGVKMVWPESAMTNRSSVLASHFGMARTPS